MTLFTDTPACLPYLLSASLRAITQRYSKTTLSATVLHRREMMVETKERAEVMAVMPAQLEAFIYVRSGRTIMRDREWHHLLFE
jgi:hypothetical protein